MHNSWSEYRDTSLGGYQVQNVPYTLSTKRHQKWQGPKIQALDHLKYNSISITKVRTYKKLTKTKVMDRWRKCKEKKLSKRYWETAMLLSGMYCCTIFFYSGHWRTIARKVMYSYVKGKLSQCQENVSSLRLQYFGLIHSVSPLLPSSLAKGFRSTPLPLGL